MFTMFYLLQTICLICFLEASSNFYIDPQGKYDDNDITQNIESHYSSTAPLITEKVGKVSRRHYEIVNVLWRKTKIFLDVDALTTTQQLSSVNDPSYTTILHTSNQCSNQSSAITPSGIEFYYWDKLEELRRQKDIANLQTDAQVKGLKTDHKLQNNLGDKLKSRILRRPIFAFHLNNKNIKEENVDTANFYLNLNKNDKNLESNETNQLRSYMNTSAMISNKRIARNNNNDTQWFSIFFNDPLNRLIRHSTNKVAVTTESTTLYDRIKFFEMYDKNTEPTIRIVSYDVGEVIPSEIVVVSPTNESENRTQMVNTIKEDNVKMYKLMRTHDSDIFLKEPNALLQEMQNILNNSYNTKTNEKLSLQINVQDEHNISSVVSKRTPKVWSKFPYIAAYIYEPLSIYCDAAAINSYWLIAAGSCLARHHKTSMVNERSAYISYCGDKWWETESVAYVRRSLIHPSFNYRDKTRRHHYNIGAVQVISSLINSCPGWSPVALVSHRFVINERGFPATAIGWGLDRYNTRFLYYNLPKRPLVAYEGLIFPKSCPKRDEHDNEEYERELNVKNIYCLSLPYMGEKKDTAHGSLLLVQGKLMALSLQKGRSGNESTAQYTGVWRLVPWVLELTRNTTSDSFSTKHLS